MLHAELVLETRAVPVREALEDAFPNAVEQRASVVEPLHRGDRLLAPCLVFGIVGVDEAVVREPERRDERRELDEAHEGVCRDVLPETHWLCAGLREGSC